MANTIKFKRASGSDPSASDLAIGEPGLRTDTAELFFKKDDGTVAKVSGGGGGPDFKYLELRNAANNGAASFPGNDFTLVTAGTTNAITPAAANTLLVSVSGVIQKPNSGTSTSGITGFIVDGSRLKTATNLPAAPDFILYQESGGIGEPSDNTVTSAKIVDGAIVNADVNASAAIARTKLANVDLVDDTSPQLGGNLDVNTKNIVFGDSGGATDDRLTFGAGTDLSIYHSGNSSYIAEGNVGNLKISSNIVQLQNSAQDENLARFIQDGAVELYFDNTKRLETSNTGATVTGTCTATAFAGDGSNLTGITAGAQGGGGESIFFESENEMNNSYTISTNHNALIAGPLTISSGATLTINSPSVVTIP